MTLNEERAINTHTRMNYGSFLMVLASLIKVCRVSWRIRKRLKILRKSREDFFLVKDMNYKSFFFFFFHYNIIMNSSNTLVMVFIFELLWGDSPKTLILRLANLCVIPRF